MNKITGYVRLLAVLLIIALLAGCSDSPSAISEEESKGSIYISVDLLTLSSDLKTIEITGSHGSEEFKETIELGKIKSRSSAYNVLVSDLSTGDWEISAAGLDADGAKFMGELTPVDVSVTGGGNVHTRITLKMLTSPATLDIDTSALSELDHLSISGTSRRGSFSHTEVSPGDLPLIEDLEFGPWTIVVTAFNSSDEEIASATAERDITSEDAASIDITLVPADTPEGIAIFTASPHRSIASRLDHYVLTGDSALDEFEVDMEPGETLYQNLYIGDWDFTLQAVDDGGSQLGVTATASASISETTPSRVDMSISPLYSEVTFNITTDETIPDTHSYSLYGSSEYDSYNQDNPSNPVQLTYGTWNLTLDTKDSDGVVIVANEVSFVVDDDTESVDIEVARKGLLLIKVSADPLITAQNPSFIIEGDREGSESTFSETLEDTVLFSREIAIGTWHITVSAEDSDGNRISNVVPADVAIDLDEETGVDITLNELRYSLEIDAVPDSTAQALITNYLVSGSNGIEAFSTESATLPISRDLTRGEWEITIIGEDDAEETIASGTQSEIALTAASSVAIALDTVVDKGSLMLQLQPDPIVSSQAHHYAITYTDSESNEPPVNSEYLIVTKELTQGDWNISVEAVDASDNVISETESIDVTVNVKKTTLTQLPIDILRYTLALTIDSSAVTSAIDHYTIEGSSSYDAFSVEQTVLTLDKSIVSGTWDLTVQAWDSDDMLVGEKDITDLEVTQNKSVTAALADVTHTGSLFLSFDIGEYLAAQGKSFGIELTDGVTTVHKATTHTGLKITDLDIGTWSYTVTSLDGSAATLASAGPTNVTILEDQTVTRTVELTVNKADLSLTVSPGTVTGAETYTYLGYSDSDAFIYEDETTATLSATDLLTPGDWRFIVIAYDGSGIPVGVYQDETDSYTTDGVTAITQTLSLTEKSAKSRALPVPSTGEAGVLVVNTSVWDEVAASAATWSLEILDASNISLETFSDLTEMTWVEPEMAPGTYNLNMTVYDGEGTEIASAPQNDVLVVTSDIAYVEVTAYPPVTSLTVLPSWDDEIGSIVNSILYVLTQEEREKVYVATGTDLSLSIDTMLCGSWNFDVSAYDAEGILLARKDGTSVELVEGIAQTSEPVLETVSADLLVQMVLDSSFTAPVDSYGITLHCTDLSWADRTYTTKNSLFSVPDKLPIGAWDVSVTAMGSGDEALSETAQTSLTVSNGVQKIRTVTLMPLTHLLTLQITKSDMNAASFTISGQSDIDSFIAEGVTSTTVLRELSPGTWTIDVIGYDDGAKEVSHGQWTGTVSADVSAPLTLQPYTGMVYLSVQPADGFSNTIGSWELTGDADASDLFDFDDDLDNSGIITKELPGGEWTFTARAFNGTTPVSDAATAVVTVKNNRSTVVDLTAEPIESSLSLGNISDAAGTSPVTYTIVGQSDSSAFSRSATSLTEYTGSLALGDWVLKLSGYDSEGIKVSSIEVSVTSDGSSLAPTGTMDRIIYEGTLCVEIDPSEYVLLHVDHFTITVDSESYDTAATFWSKKVEIGTKSVSVKAYDDVGSVIAQSDADPDPVISTGKTTLSTVALSEAKADLTVTINADSTLTSQIDHYHLTIIGPDDVIDVPEWGSDIYTLDNITPGSWIVKVKAYNSSAQVIASAETTLDISAGEIALCSLDLETATGDLYLNFLPDDVVQSLVDHYSVELSNGGEPITAKDIYSSSWVHEDLDVGFWDITVHAFKADGVLVGTGSLEDVSIAPNKTNIVNIDVNQTEAALGDFALSVTYPDAVTIAATLTGSDEIANDIPITGNSGTLSDLMPGYYVLLIEIYDGEVLCGSHMETIQITGGETTEITADIEMDTGSVTVFITDPPDDVITVVLSGLDDDETVTYDDSLFITVDAAVSVTPDSISWYLNGEQLSTATATEYSVTLTSLDPGWYQITCVVLDDGVLGSDSINFGIVE